MKAVKIFLIVLFTTLALSFTQAQVSQKIMSHCLITETAKQNILEINPVEQPARFAKMSEFNQDCETATFMAELGIMYLWARAEIPQDEVAGNLWHFISKQLNGEAGNLSTNKTNMFETRFGRKIMFVLVGWDAAQKKWRIKSTNTIPLTGIKKGVREFCYSL